MDADIRTPPAQAHCDYLLTDGHQAAEFAMWWNARLLEAHVDLDGPALTSSQLPQWAGGTWTPPTSAQSHAQAMMEALGSAPQVAGEAAKPVGGAASRVRAFRPGLPMPSRRRTEPSDEHIHILQGRCSAQKARVMSFGECEAFAAQEKKHFLGRSVDAAEYPGCTLWDDTQLVEFNDHANEQVGCIQAPRGHCICIRHPSSIVRHGRRLGSRHTGLRTGRGLDVLNTSLAGF